MKTYNVISTEKKVKNQRHQQKKNDEYEYLTGEETSDQSKMIK